MNSDLGLKQLVTYTDGLVTLCDFMFILVVTWVAAQVVTLL